MPFCISVRRDRRRCIAVLKIIPRGRFPWLPSSELAVSSETVAKTCKLDSGRRRKELNEIQKKTRPIKTAVPGFDVPDQSDNRQMRSKVPTSTSFLNSTNYADRARLKRLIVKRFFRTYISRFVLEFGWGARKTRRNRLVTK